MLRRFVVGLALLTPLKAVAMWPFNSSVVTETSTGLRIEDKPGDRPKFERVYSAGLTNGRSIIVKCHTSYGGDRYKSGEMDQPGGRWILFDPDAVADKIIDPGLVSLVQSRCDEIAKIDKAYIASAPSEFIDEGGVRWRRVTTS